MQAAVKFSLHHHRDVAYQSYPSKRSPSCSLVPHGHIVESTVRVRHGEHVELQIGSKFRLFFSDERKGRKGSSMPSIFDHAGFRGIT